MATTHTPSGPPRLKEAAGTYAVTGVLLLVTMVALLAVPTYAHLTPSLGGIPFFYWYTLLWLLINAVLQAVAYFILARTRRRPASDNTAGPQP